jgi:hypothetical protein
MFNYREKIVDVWYLGTNQNGIIFELLTANTYMNQRTQPACGLGLSVADLEGECGTCAHLKFAKHMLYNVNFKQFNK